MSLRLKIRLSRKFHKRYRKGTIINVDGNSATAWFVRTGFINEDIKGAPKVLEQGTEFDELVKVNDQWFIKKRYITADSGLSAGNWPNYKPRSFR